MSEKTRGTLKAFVGLVVGGCVGLVMENVARAVMPDNASKWHRMGTTLGSAAMAWIVGCAAADAAEQCVDQTEHIVAQLMGDTDFDEAVEDGPLEAEGSVE